MSALLNQADVRPLLLALVPEVGPYIDAGMDDSGLLTMYELLEDGLYALLEDALQDSGSDDLVRRIYGVTELLLRHGDRQGGVSAMTHNYTGRSISDARAAQRPTLMSPWFRDYVGREQVPTWAGGHPGW